MRKDRKNEKPVRDYALERLARLTLVSNLMRDIVPPDSAIETFTFTDAIDAAWDWVFETTHLGWLFLIGIFLVIGKVAGWFGDDAPWISVLWPFIVVVGSTLIAALVFSMKYDLKVTVENELEAKEYREMVSRGRRWVGSGVDKVILRMKWKKK